VTLLGSAGWTGGADLRVLWRRQELRRGWKYAGKRRTLERLRRLARVEVCMDVGKVVVFCAEGSKPREVRS
jgi:hypothetical protein